MLDKYCGLPETLSPLNKLYGSYFIGIQTNGAYFSDNLIIVNHILM